MTNADKRGLAQIAGHSPKRFKFSPTDITEIANFTQGSERSKRRNLAIVLL